jgi:hypothetical protein
MAITNAQLAAQEALTPANLLLAVDQAIATILLGGQSYTINGRQFTRANLNDLMKIKSDLQAIVNAGGTSGGGMALVQFGEAQ